jgi:hypothetical protein
MAKTQKPGKRPAPPAPGDPEVLLDVEHDRGCLFLVLANVGPAPAFDVRVSFEKPLLGAGGATDIAALEIFRKLPNLRPGKDGRRGSKQVRARVTYRTRTRTCLGETFTHDLRMWGDWPEVRFGEKET